MEEREGIRQGDGVVRRHGVCHRVRRSFFFSLPVGTDSGGICKLETDVLLVLPCAQYRARNDIGNAVAAGFIAGGVLARNTGPRGALWGGLGFSAFSAAIDLFLRRETPE